MVVLLLRLLVLLSGLWSYVGVFVVFAVLVILGLGDVWCW